MVDYGLFYLLASISADVGTLELENYVAVVAAVEPVAVVAKPAVFAKLAAAVSAPAAVVAIAEFSLGSSVDVTEAVAVVVAAAELDVFVVGLEETVADWQLQ